MKKGDSVKVKQGILDPDLNQFDMSGWQGRIINITREKASEIVEIAWDSITLKQLPEEYIKDSLEEGYDFATMFLGKEDVELAQPRDTQTDVEKQLAKTNEQYQHYAFGEEEKRIAAILSDDDLEVTEEKQDIYFDYLQKHIQKGVMLTGTETFPWEEKYLFGGGSKKEHENLTKTQASSKDKFELIELMDDIDEDYGIIAKVRRVTDKKQFELPLWDLGCTDENSKSYELISDYSYWMTNCS
jgi:hypothetical protein